jgi:hypothetical protein
MARRSLGDLSRALFRDVLAPLALGGTLTPGPALGPRAALALAAAAPADGGDPMLASEVRTARLRVVRALCPVDGVPDPEDAVWSLAAALHDLLLVLHPSLRSPLRRRAPHTLLGLVDATLARVSPPVNVALALSRHGWFARVFEIARTDAHVVWWAGARRYEGREPPARVFALPGLRKVHVERTRLALDELGARSPVGRVAFEATLASWLERTPLTDLATCARGWPSFAWRPGTIALVQAPLGRTLALRALARADAGHVDHALGAATRALSPRAHAKALEAALAVLGERALARAQAALRTSPVVPATEDASADAAYARVAGATRARAWLEAGAGAFREAERRALLAALARA